MVKACLVQRFLPQALNLYSHLLVSSWLLKLLHVISAISTKLTPTINCTSRRQGGYCIDIVFRDEYVNIVACVWVATKKSPYFSSFLSILSQEVCRLSHRLACKLDKEQYLLQNNESAMHAFSATTNFLS